MALVLIAGAAIVLWYGSTLNSWILGGLIGGLAALLLSIPISLTLFSFFSRRRDEQHQDEEVVFVREEISFAQHGSYALPRARGIREVYTVDKDDPYEQDVYPENYTDEFDNAYDGEYEEMLVEENYPRSRRTMWENEEDEDYNIPPERYLSAPYSSRSATPHNRQKSRQLPAAQQGSDNEARQHGQGKKNAAIPRPVPRRTGYMSFSGYQADPLRSRYRSEAMRIARKEAAQQASYDDEIDDASPLMPRRYGARAAHLLPAYDEQDPLQESKAFSQSESRYRDPRFPRRVVDSLSPQRSRYTRPPEEEEADMADRYDESNMPGQRLRKSLMHRAPYPSEDDPAHWDTTHHSRRPIVRRASRYLNQSYDDGTT